MSIFWIAVAGALGVLARYFADTWVESMKWPVFAGTFLINIFGCLIAGAVVGFLSGHDHSSLRSVLLVGFCGGFTTFSAYALQSFEMFASGEWRWATLNIALTPLIGLLSLSLGMACSKIP